MTNQNDKGPMLDEELDEVSGGLIAIIPSPPTNQEAPGDGTMFWNL